MRESWAEFVSPVREEELAEIRRHVAATGAAMWSGSSGRARRCAAVAAGVATWKASADMEMELLSVSVEEVNATLGTVSVWGDLRTTGAGVLPITELDED
jgi:hypothetical protein